MECLKSNRICDLFQGKTSRHLIIPYMLDGMIIAVDTWLDHYFVLRSVWVRLYLAVDVIHVHVSPVKVLRTVMEVTGNYRWLPGCFGMVVTSKFVVVAKSILFLLQYYCLTKGLWLCFKTRINLPVVRRVQSLSLTGKLWPPITPTVCETLGNNIM